MKYLGCAYYPEYWGPERVETDARLMQEAGINLARIGEFAWSRMEPEEGRFTLDWLHAGIATLGRHGIRVLMCTPTAAPPAWLTSAYPDTCLCRANGERAVHGRRRHYCPSSPAFRRFSERITDVLSRELARHGSLVAWQLDNEFGPELGWCFCEHCQTRFQAWLQARYPTLDELNRRWRTGFWSMDYSEWRQVRLGTLDQDAHSSRALDSKRFWSDTFIDFARHQTDVIRRNMPGVPVTTNGMGPIFSPIDYYTLFGDLDVACDDLYFDIATMDANVAAMNVFRSLKPGRRYWITETGSGALDHNKPPHAGQFRAWAWSSLAHGGEAHLVFRWRTCLSGQEQELQGILEHSGEPRHRYRAVKDCFTEMRRLWPVLQDAPLPEAPVAILQDYQALWSYEASRVGRDVDYPGLILRLHRSLYRRHVVADFIPPGRDLSAYRLLVLPSLPCIGAELAARLRAYVEQGGTILALGQIGLRDAYDNYLDRPGPDGLQELFGLKLHGGMFLRSHVGPDEALWVPAANSRAMEIPMDGAFDGAPTQGRACGWAADVELAGGRDLFRFGADAFAGQPAVVHQRTARGSALYVGCLRSDTEWHERLVDYALRLAGVSVGPVTPEYVEVTRRGRFVFAINHTDAAVKVPLNVPAIALVGSYRDGTADLGPYGVCVVQAEA